MKNLPLLWHKIQLIFYMILTLRFVSIYRFLFLKIMNHLQIFRISSKILKYNTLVKTPNNIKKKTPTDELIHGRFAQSEGWMDGSKGFSRFGKGSFNAASLLANDWILLVLLQRLIEGRFARVTISILCNI